MTPDDKPPGLAGLLALETRVWEALKTGDRAADLAALTETFVGVYPTGVSDREGHAGQFADAPTVEAYEIREARAQVYAPDLAMLIYLARYKRPGENWAEMWISSLWKDEGDAWRNLFSQDTPVA